MNIPNRNNSWTAALFLNLLILAASSSASAQQGRNHFENGCRLPATQQQIDRISGLEGCQLIDPADPKISHSWSMKLHCFSENCDSRISRFQIRLTRTDKTINYTCGIGKGGEEQWFADTIISRSTKMNTDTLEGTTTAYYSLGYAVVAEGNTALLIGDGSLLNHFSTIESTVAKTGEITLGSSIEEHIARETKHFRNESVRWSDAAALQQMFSTVQPPISCHKAFLNLDALVSRIIDQVQESYERLPLVISGGADPLGKPLLGSSYDGYSGDQGVAPKVCSWSWKKIGDVLMWDDAVENCKLPYHSRIRESLFQSIAIPVNNFPLY